MRDIYKWPVHRDEKFTFVKRIISSRWETITLSSEALIDWHTGKYWGVFHLEKYTEARQRLIHESSVYCFPFSKMKLYMFFEGYLLNPNAALAVIFLVFGVYTVVGNILVCVVYILDPGKKLRRVSNSYFVINLAVADILVGITVEPINAASYWSKNTDVLFSYYIFAVLSCVCSIVNISALMVDRFLAVCRPFKYRSLVKPSRVRTALLIIWLFSIHFAILPLVGWRSASFQVYLYGLGVLSPAAIMLGSYYGLLRALKEKITNLQSSADRKEATHVRKMVARERSVSMTVFIMLMVFLVAWGPFVMVDFVLVFCENCRSEKLLLARDITLTVGFFSSGINPGLYAWRIPNFRHGLTLLFRRGMKTKSKLVRVTPLGNGVKSPAFDSQSYLDKTEMYGIEEGASKNKTTA